MAGEIILGVVGWVVGCFIMAGVVENIKEGRKPKNENR